MRKAFLAVLILTGGVYAAPTSKPTTPPVRPAARPASQPTTAPARVDPAFVADFNAHLLGAKFNDVVAKLKATGALALGPTLKFEGGNGKLYRATYSVSMGYAWEYTGYQFAVDGDGKIYKFEFGGAVDGAGRIAGGSSAERPGDKLKPGNKWYLVHRWPQSVPGFADGRAASMRVQAASPAEAATTLVEICRKADEATAKALHKPSPLPTVKATDVEVHEWFIPRLARDRGERTD